jgi:hypothetical protein
MSNPNPHTAEGLKWWVAAIILYLLLNLLTKEQQDKLWNGVVSMATPKSAGVPAPTKWIVRNGVAIQVPSYAANTARPPQPYYSSRGGY